MTLFAAQKTRGSEIAATITSNVPGSASWLVMFAVRLDTVLVGTSNIGFYIIFVFFGVSIPATF